MTTKPFTRKWAYEGSLALLILAGSVSAPVLASGNEADQQSRITDESQSVANQPVSPEAQPSAKEVAEGPRKSDGVDPSRRGASIRLVQYRTAARPVYSAQPAQGRVQRYTAQPARVASALAQGSPLAIPMMAAPVFTQPLRSAYNSWQPRYQQQSAGYYQQPAASYGYGGGGGDPYGFTSWLNSVRAQYGLRPVSYDPSLASWAAANNSAQASRGLGHFVMGPATRQNAAIGSVESIRSQWMNSPAHRAALLDPNISSIGLSGSGSYWTMNAR